MVRAAALAALMMTSMPAAAQAVAGFTLRDWTRLDSRERQVSMVAAIEGLLLATSASGGASVDDACLLKLTLPSLDADLRQAAATRDGEFVTVMVEVSKCSRS